MRIDERALRLGLTDRVCIGDMQLMIRSRYYGPRIAYSLIEVWAAFRVG
jgi:hypothetical protein